MKELISLDGVYNDEGKRIAKRLDAALRPIIKEELKAGASPRDLRNLVENCGLEVSMIHLLESFEDETDVS